MTRPIPAAIALAALVLAPQARAQMKQIDLRTAEGVAAVKGEWRYGDVKLVEVDAPSGKGEKTYDIAPHAEKADYDDSGWEVIRPETLKDRRAAGKVCFAWYRIKVTLPEEAEGKAVHFVTVVDDYGEVWVDGKLPFKEGQQGGTVVAGFNAPNRVELKDARAGKTYAIAVFAINGPISAAPTNRIFLRDAHLEIGPAQ